MHAGSMLLIRMLTTCGTGCLASRAPRSLEPHEFARAGRSRAFGHSGPPRHWHPDASSAVEHRPADVVSQPLVVEDELTDRSWELVTLPSALASPDALALVIRRAGTCGLDCVGGGTELVRGDVCDARGLAGSVRGMSWRPTQLPGRAHRTAARRARLHHLDLATHPCAGVLDRPTGAPVLGLRRLEQVKDVLRTRSRHSARRW